MTLRVELSVKFRSFGITWGTIRREWRFELPPEVVVWQPKPMVHLDERGVKLDIWTE